MTSEQTRRHTARTGMTDNGRDSRRRRPLVWVGPDRSVCPDQTCWRTRRAPESTVMGMQGRGAPSLSACRRRGPGPWLAGDRHRGRLVSDGRGWAARPPDRMPRHAPVVAAIQGLEDGVRRPRRPPDSGQECDPRTESLNASVFSSRRAANRLADTLTAPEDRESESSCRFPRQLFQYRCPRGR